MFAALLMWLECTYAASLCPLCFMPWASFKAFGCFRECLTLIFFCLGKSKMAILATKLWHRPLHLCCICVACSSCGIPNSESNACPWLFCLIFGPFPLTVLPRPALIQGVVLLQLDIPCLFDISERAVLSWREKWKGGKWREELGGERGRERVVGM